MKIRGSFVSNSSSSSFIISYNDNLAKVEGFEFSFADLKNYLESRDNGWDCESTKLVASTKESVIERIQSEWFDGDYKNELMKKVKGCDNLAIINVAYSDAIGKKLVEFLKCHGVIDILNEE